MRQKNPYRIAAALARRLRRFAQDDAGVTSIEYALLGSLIAVAIAGAVGATGQQVQALYEHVSTQVVAALSQS